MRKKTLAILLMAVMFISVFGNIPSEADTDGLTTPRVSVVTKKRDSYVRIKITNTKDAYAYEVSYSGLPINSEYCAYFKYVDADGRISMRKEFNEKYIKDDKKKIYITHKDLQPGTYTVKVRAYAYDKDASPVYSEWNEQTFIIREALTKGYSKEYDLSEVKKGEVIKFGAYEQDLNYSNGKEPIEWIVLDKTEDLLFLLSKYALDRLPFDKKCNHDIWRDCPLRKWLNNVFIKSAFNSTEKKMLKNVHVEINGFAELASNEDNDSTDKVFLLSEDEAKNPDYGFAELSKTEDVYRKCSFAWYRKTSESDDDSVTEEMETCWWWLRTRAYEFGSVVQNVNALGVINVWGNPSDDIDLINGYFDGNSAGVRPAIFISLK